MSWINFPFKLSSKYRYSLLHSNFIRVYLQTACNYSENVSVLKRHASIPVWISPNGTDANTTALCSTKCRLKWGHKTTTSFHVLCIHGMFYRLHRFNEFCGNLLLTQESSFIFIFFLSSFGFPFSLVFLISTNLASSSDSNNACDYTP